MKETPRTLIASAQCSVSATLPLGPVVIDVRHEVDYIIGPPFHVAMMFVEAAGQPLGTYSLVRDEAIALRDWLDRFIDASDPDDRLTWP